MLGSFKNPFRKKSRDTLSPATASGQLGGGPSGSRPRYVSAGSASAIPSILAAAADTPSVQSSTNSQTSPTRPKLFPQGSLDSSQRAMQKLNIAESFLGSQVGFFADSEEEKLAIYKSFMEQHKCYDLIPTSTKVVVFDTDLLVKKAFYALVYNGVRAAPLWDSNREEFVGMLTITDFINILRKYHRSNLGINQQLEEEKISSWKNFEESKANFISIDVNQSLLDAVTLLCSHKVHRLPVVNRITGNVLYILTHKRILRFLHLYKKDIENPRYMSRAPKDLGIGSWSNIKTVTRDTLLIDALGMFIECRISALPVVDDDGRCVDIYAKFDVIHLAAEKAYSRLDVPLRDILKMRQDWFEGVHSCVETDSLQDVIEKLVNAEVHRMVITDAKGRVVGVLSLSDILKFLVLDAPNRSVDEWMDTS